MTADAVGGVWTYAVDLARALVAHHIEVDLAVLGPSPSPAQRDEVSALGHVRLFECGGRLEWMDDPWQDVDAAGEWLLGLERACRPDIVHLNGYCHGALRWTAPVLMAGHSCVRSWWRAVMGEDAPCRFDRYTSLARSGLAAAALVVAPSEAMRTCLVHHYGPLAHTRVIPNGRSILPGDPVARAPLILSAGRFWDAAKNIRALDDVAADLSWTVTVAGDTDGASAVGGAHRLGRLGAADLAGWMRRASIFALPARYEPFGLSILEAAQAGCALVLGDIASLREIWDDAAVYVPPDDRLALKTALETLIADASLRETMGWRARERSRRFTAERMASGYVAAYASLLDEAASGSAAGAPRHRSRAAAAAVL